VTKPASAAAALAAPCPSLFSASGGLAEDLVEAYLTVRKRDRVPRRSADGRGSADPVDAGCEPGEVAPRPYHMVLRAISCSAKPARNYTPFHPDYAFLFNSYYVSAGPRHARHQRGHLTRPGADEITAYRRHVDATVVKFFQTADEDTLAALAPLVEVGLNHEQQHQELMLTDILHAFAQNPISAGLRSGVALPRFNQRRRREDSRWRREDSRRRRMGHAQRGHSHGRARRRQRFISTTRSPRTALWWGRSGWRATSSPMPNGSHS